METVINMSATEWTTVINMIGNKAKRDEYVDLMVTKEGDTEVTLAIGKGKYRAYVALITKKEDKVRNRIIYGGFVSNRESFNLLQKLLVHHYGTEHNV